MKAQIQRALEETEKMLPKSPKVACQGVAGAYSNIAAKRLFREPEISFYNSFEAVFKAVVDGECEFGVLPIENSTAGSVNAIYDLLMQYQAYIVKSVRIKIDHSLLAKPGVKEEDIKEIYSHPQAIAQCSEYLKEHENIIVTQKANTAMSAMEVAQSDRMDLAALSSRECAELYGLRSLRNSVQNKDNNYTRFICISRTLKIYPGADRTSIIATLPHKPGALFNALKIFNDADFNLIKIESRPIADRDFEFRFYFDFEISVYDENFDSVLEEFKAYADEFTYLGSYLELV